MDRALAYLLAMRLKNTLMGVVRRPSRLLGVVILIALFALVVVGGQEARDSGVVSDPRAQQTVLVAVLALYLLLATLGGLGEPGLGFLPADMDYVLPGPFRRREVLVYHLARQYAQILILAIMYVAFLGAGRMPRPVLAYVAVVLCLLVAAHLQAAATLVAGHVGDRFFGRLRRISRTGLLALLAVAAAVAVVGIAGASDVSGLLGRILGSRPAQVLLYPAIAAGRAAVSPNLAAAWPWLAGLLACVLVSFGVVLLFPVNLVETTYVTAVERRRRLTTAGKERSRAHSTSGRLRGAAAVAWLNTLVLRRRLRMVVGLGAMLIVMLLATSGRGGGESLPGLITILALFPVLANLPLGFRGQRDHLETLKTLPLDPLRVAAAQVSVPVLLILLAQGLVLAIFAMLGRIEVRTAAGVLVTLPVLDIGVVSVVEAFHLGRDPRQAGFLWATLQMLAIFATLIPATLTGVLAYALTSHRGAAFATAFLTHAVVAYGLVRLLGWRFRTWEPGSDTP